MRPLMMTALALALAAPALAQEEAPPPPVDTPVFQAADVFNLEFAADPQISPDGERIVYARQSFDVMSDRSRSNLWLVDAETGVQRPLLSGTESYSSPRWSPDGKRLAYVTSADGGAQIYVRWMDTGATARVTNLVEAPASLAWSPGGEHIAFTMFKPQKPEPFAKMPAKPEGAEWAPDPIIIDQMNYRGDGEGYYEQGFTHLFVVPADGGTPRQLTRGDYDHNGTPSWSPDGRTLYISADRTENWQRESGRPEIFAVSVEGGDIRPLTENDGVDTAPRVSPDGRRIAYLRNTDNLKAWQPLELWVMNIDGSEDRRLASGLDRSVADIIWSDDGDAVYFLYDDEGDTKLGLAPLSGDMRTLASGLGGESLGRPYSGASFSVADDGKVAFNITSATHPADLAVLEGGDVRRLTNLNEDITAVRRFSPAEEMWTTAADGVRSESWILFPPGFDPSRKYPMILEIHGGPHSNYGPRFSAEAQLYAADGYVVLYSNPRGSTSYGAEFGNEIDKAYPGGDYDDLMAAVDGVIAKGYVDPERLFVTGGSGGGVLTAWIVGKTDRFKAAVVAKPVINWTSFVLNADGTPYFYKYWFGAKPWEDQESYWSRSPLSLVGNVTTPTMLLTGEADYRTPISETEQYYAALQLEGVPTAMVRIPEASHSITARPSNLIAKVNHILAWFDRYDQPATAPAVALRNAEGREAR